MQFDCWRWRMQLDCSLHDDWSFSVLLLTCCTKTTEQVPFTILTFLKTGRIFYIVFAYFTVAPFWQTAVYQACYILSYPPGKKTLFQLHCRDRIVVSTLRCGRSNPGSNPGHGKCDRLCLLTMTFYVPWFGEKSFWNIRYHVWRSYFIVYTEDACVTILKKRLVPMGFNDQSLSSKVP